MEVTLDPIDWKKISQFKPIEKFFAYLDEVEEYQDWILNGSDHGWDSDSGTQYFGVAEIVEHLNQYVDPKTLALIESGVKPLISENSQLDELGTSPVTDNCYWISISPDSTKRIYDSLSQLDLNYLADTLRKHPGSFAQDVMHNIDWYFIGFIKQHLAVVKTAVDRGYGLLGHIG